MAKKKKIAEDVIENYYDLKIKQTDELVAILKEEQGALDGEPLTMDIAEITGEAPSGRKRKKFNPYSRDKLASIPFWVKALFIKWWFVGAVTYFMVFGFGASLQTLDLIVLTGIVLGLVADIFVNPIFMMMESDLKEYNAFMMFPFPFKKYWTFFANVLYYTLVYIIVSLIYAGINYAGGLINVEPLLCGVFTLAVDMAFIGLKDLAVFIIKKTRRKEQSLNV